MRKRTLFDASKALTNSLDQDSEQSEDVPDAILLERDFGFAVNGCVRTWPAGKMLTKRADILELLAHDAPARCFREIR